MRKILIIDDDSNFIGAILTELNANLNANHCSFSVADSISRAKSLLKLDNFDFILANATVPGGRCVKLKKAINKSSPNAQIYFMSSVDKHYKRLVNHGEQCFHKYELHNNIGGLFAV